MNKTTIISCRNYKVQSQLYKYINVGIIVQQGQLKGFKKKMIIFLSIGLLD